MRISRAAILSGITMFGLAAGAAAPAALAQTQMPGWFGSLTGWWYPWNDNGDRFTVTEGGNLGDVAFGARPGDGFGGRVHAGYRFSNPYDVALGLQGTWFDRGKTGNGIVDGDEPSSIRQKASYRAGDIEFGYNGATSLFGYRLFLGARYAEFKHKADGKEDIGGTNDPIRSHDKFRGVGPRIGASGAYRLAPDSNFSIFGDIAGAYLLGRHRASTCADGCDPGSGRSAANVWNLEGQLGVAYEVAPNVNVGVGYRGEYWSRVVFTRLDPQEERVIYRSGDRLAHGPFARVSFNIGAPRAPAPAPVAAAPAPAAVMTKNFIVFFDFDRSDLTAQAQDTIREAAAASKTGGTQRVNVTGHADKSGGDAYNMALSLRRANTVKDELVRNGVPANAIVVVARGETQPVVPTADGVREPQNRRVEIVLN